LNTTIRSSFMSVNIAPTSRAIGMDDGRMVQIHRRIRSKLRLLPEYPPRWKKNAN
jgi:hypothetical protein